MLAIDATFNFIDGVLTLDYNQPDGNGFVSTSNQNAFIEIDEIGPSPQTVRVNLYRSSNPNADVYLGVTQIVVNVPNFDTPGVNNNSLTIKGLESAGDRLIMVGSGRTAAGRWFDQLPDPDQNQIRFEITGIDNLTLTAGGSINVSGSFTNDTEDASITVIGTSLEAEDGRTPYPNQHTATVVLGENTPQFEPGAFPQPRLESNYIHVIGGSIEINANIYARGEVSLKASEFTAAPSNLLLPHDITVAANPNGSPGRLNLFAAKSVIQQSTSTIRASLVNVVAENTLTPFGQAVIDLSSHKNDFDEITIRTGTALAASTGSVAIRDCDDLVITNNGLLSTTGLMTVHTVGLLTIDTPIKAGEFKAYSGTAITSTKRGILTIGNGGLDLAARAVATSATGDITLNGRIEIGSNSLPAVVINNSIRSDGTITIAGGFYAPQGGATLVEGLEGVLIASPVQVGNTFFNATSTEFTVTDADLTLVSSNGFVDILDFSGNAAIPQAVQVTNMLSIDAFGDVFIDGQVFVGTRYGNALALRETVALPNIFVRGQADITIGQSGRLETSSYETNADIHVNALVGAIRIVDATQFTNFGAIKADGALEIDVKGDVYTAGTVMARESITVTSGLGMIDVQGAISTTGYRYASNLPIPLQERRIPNITLSAPSGSILTGGRGTLQTGTLEAAESIFGEVRLEAQQAIIIGANIISDGGVIADVLFGGFEIDALLRAGNQQAVEIRAGDGIYSRELGRIETSLLDVTVPEGGVAADIDLPALGNRVRALQARNFTPGGSTQFFTDSLLDVQLVETLGDVDIAATGTIDLTGLTQSLGGSLDIRSQGGGLNVAGNVMASMGDVRLTSTSGDVYLAANVHARDERIVITAHGELRQAQAGGLARIELVEGGRFSGTQLPEVTITITGPAGGGETATAVAVIGVIEPAIPPSSSGGLNPVVIPGTPPTFGITSIVLTNPGSGYAVNELPQVTIEGMPGAVALAIPSAGQQHLVAGKGIMLAAGADVVLSTVTRANSGDVIISSIDGDLDLSAVDQLVHAVKGNISLESKARGATVRQLTSGGNVAITTLRDVNVHDRIDSATGDVSISAISGGVAVQGGIHAVVGKINVSAGVGTDQLYAATVRNLEAGDDLTVVATGGLAVRNQIISTGGDIILVSHSDSVDLRTANVQAMAGEIKIAAHGAVTQPSSTGILDIVLLAGGEFVGERPDVRVTIEAPRGGGTQATAVATTRIFGWIPDGGGGIVVPPAGPTVIVPEGATPVWQIVAITLTNPGSGYAPLEEPLVTISLGENGESNAAARAIGPGSFPTIIVGKNDVQIEAGTNIRLTSIVRSNVGDVSIRSIDGDVDLSDPNQLVHAVKGSVVLDTLAGGIEYQRIIAAQDITLQSFRTLTINNQLTTSGGDVTLASRGADLVINANVLAADTINISAKTGITQNDGILKATNLRASNITPTPITLGNAANDVDRFAASNVGDVTFADANDFRVGLRTSGTMGVEVSGANVTLSAPGTIRVVAGIQARSLAIAAPTVDFVTTNAADSNATAFAGRLRDMIGISNQNTDRQAGHFMVFDEDGEEDNRTEYALSEISVAAALPQFTRAVTFDGGRVHDSVATGRLGILGKANVRSGLYLGAGSAGSTIRGAAIAGFSDGSAIVVESGRNTIEDMYVGYDGFRDNGTRVSANRVGVNVTGTRANSNTIGSFVFDDTTANRFAGNNDAAIVVQRGASNNLIAGNVVGVNGLAANRTGIRIDGGAGNRIGTADQVTADGTPTPSNQIRGNTHYGIEIRNVRGTNTVVENNVVAGNATKAGNGAHGIGVLNSMNVVIGGASELARNQVFSQLGGSGIHLSGSSKVAIIGNHIGTEGYHLTADSANPPGLGNGRHGIDVFGRSRDVQITANRIVDNGGSGVAIASGSTGVVLTRNEIGVFTHPVTGNVHGAGNKADGVTITAANGNVVGAGNLIGFNAGSGVRVENSVAAGLPTGNRVAGSEIFGNLGHGVHVVGSSRQMIGGTGANDGNIVKENLLDGVRIEANPRIRASAGPVGNLVTGNFLGTNENEEIDRSWGNRTGVTVVNGTDNTITRNVVMNNKSGGIEIAGGSGNTVGGTTTAAGNFIGYNLGDGVFIHDQAATYATQQDVGVVGTSIVNSGAGYSASRTSVIFTAPAANGGVPARGIAIIEGGRVTGIRITSSGSGYFIDESVSVSIFDPQATTMATATVSLAPIQAATPVSRQHAVSGNMIEGNNGVGVYVKGSRVTEVTIGQSLSGSTPVGAGNTIANHHVGVIVDSASRVGIQGNRYQDNGSPIEMLNGANTPIRTRPSTGVVNTTITSQGSGYSAGRTQVTFAPPRNGGVAATGTAIVDNLGRVTGIQLTSRGQGYDTNEPVSVMIADRLATAVATATVQLGNVGLDVLNLASFVSGRNQTTVIGNLDHAGAFHQYWVDVYATPHWDMEYDANGTPDGHQMRQFLGRALVTTDANGRATLNIAINQAVEVGDYVSVQLTSARFEAGTTVGIFHSQVRHSLAAIPTPSPTNSSPTPTEPSPPSTTNPPPTRGPVPPSRT